jgi:hypothetical protein
MKTENSKRGRKPKNISFSFEKNRAFTVNDIFNRYKNGKNKISKVAISVRLKKMVAAGEVRVVGKKTSKNRGRPWTLFKLA